MNAVTIDLKVPSGWEDLDDRQLEYLFGLFAMDFSMDEVRTLFLLRQSGAKVIGKSPSGDWLMKLGKQHFYVTPMMIAEATSSLEWIADVPAVPVRVGRMHRHKAIEADFSEVPFERYIIADNLYQGFLQTKDDALLDELAHMLYGHEWRLKPWQRIAVFYWMASLKNFFAAKFSDFYNTMGSDDGNLIGSQPPSVEAAVNAQIRALTKGDVTKEKEVLALDTWRALTELDALAREYKELNAKLKQHS